MHVCTVLFTILGMCDVRIHCVHTFNIAIKTQFFYYATHVQGDLIDAVNDPKDGWQYGENHTTGK